MITLYSNLPTLDLHGMDRDYARILINDFIRDNYNIKNDKVVIVHGNPLILFQQYPSLEALSSADLSELEKIIRPVGSFRKKSFYVHRRV